MKLLTAILLSVLAFAVYMEIEHTRHPHCPNASKVYSGGCDKYGEICNSVTYKWVCPTQKGEK